MALSWSEEVVPAGTSLIPVNIEYLDKSYIHVYIDNALLDSGNYSWNSDSLIQLNQPLSATSTVLLVRRTDKTQLYIMFAEGAAFIKENLDTQNKQFLHLAQELVEGRSIDGFYGDISMNGYRITNLGDGVNPGDAVNKKQLDEVDQRVANIEGSFVTSTTSYPFFELVQTTKDTFSPPFVFDKAAVYINGLCQVPGYSYVVVDNQILLAEPVPAGTEFFARLGEDVTDEDGYATVQQLLNLADLFKDDADRAEAAADRADVSAEQVADAAELIADAVALKGDLAANDGPKNIGTEKGATLDVALQDINSGYFAEFGPQLRKLNSALLDPLVQELQITFIGDSITWGTGSSGAAPSGTRDGTLSDPRNNSTSPSYVNQLGRLIAAILGPGTVTTFSNHSYSPSGESIREMVADKYEFPYGSAYSVVGSGSFMDVIDTNVTGPYLGARRTITVTTGASVSLSFNFTGSKFSLVYSQLPNSADYELLVNGVSQGVFTTRGATAFNTRRSHSFGYVTNGTITIRAVQHPGDTSNQQLRLEALLFPKTVRIKNQGIIGTTTERYALYNFPTALSRPKPYPPQNMPGFSQTFVGDGWHEYAEIVEPNAILGMRYKYTFMNSGSWEITLNPGPTDDRVAIYFSSTDKTCDVQVFADGVAIETFHTSSNEQGVPFGYQNSRVVSIPAGTTTVKIKTVFVQYQSGVSYLYLEGVRTFNSSNQAYPTNNHFNDGVALDDKDMFAFFQVGVNDRSSNQVKSPTQIRMQLEKMLSLVPQGCSPILMASNPAAEAGNYSMQDMVQAIRQTAEKNNVVFIDNFNLFDKYSMTYFTTDNLHPNDIGHNMIARNIFKSIRSC